MVTNSRNGTEHDYSTERNELDQGSDKTRNEGNENEEMEMVMKKWRNGEMEKWRNGEMEKWGE